jgi:hypothetical protein
MSTLDNATMNDTLQLVLTLVFISLGILTVNYNFLIPAFVIYSLVWIYYGGICYKEYEEEERAMRVFN